MFRRRYIVKKGGDGENPFLLTFSDFMASLLAIFILVLIVTLIELKKKENDLDKQKVELGVNIIASLEGIQNLQDSVANALQGVSQRERTLTTMLVGIQNELHEHDIDIVLAENGTVLRIPEKQLQFALGKFEIPSAHAGAASAIGHVLLQALTNPENQALLDTVFIEGHTDSVPKQDEMGNWGLSTYRAISLWKFWTENPGVLAALKNIKTMPADHNIPAKPLISVSGYADTRSTHGLLDGKGLNNARSEDRRIDIRFTLVSSEKQSLEVSQGNLNKMRDATKMLIQKLKSPINAP